MVTQTGPETWVVDSRVTMEDLREMTGIAFAEGSYDTVSGFAVSIFERIPDAGEQALVQVPAQPYDDDSELEQTGASSDDSSSSGQLTLRLTVLESGERRIRSLQIECESESESAIDDNGTSEHGRKRLTANVIPHGGEGEGESTDGASRANDVERQR